MKKKLLLKCMLVWVYIFQITALIGQNTQFLSVQVDTAGTLNTLIAPDKKYTITNLTLSGYLNDTDVLYIREMCGGGIDTIVNNSGKLKNLNLADARIVPSDEIYYQWYNRIYKTDGNIISACMFSNITQLDSIVLPRNTMIIDKGAFSGCTGLTYIDWGSNLFRIEDEAFNHCLKLTTINLSEGLVFLGDGAFNQCTSLTSLIIPNSIQSMGGSTFIYCTGLTAITIPENLTDIGDNFVGCSGVREFIVSEKNPKFCAVEGVLFSKDKRTLYYYPNKRADIYSIPEGTKTVDDCAFQFCNNLTSVTIPESVTSINAETFWHCISLSEIKVSERNTEYCSENGVLFAKNKDVLLAFPNANSSTYKIPEGTTSIGEGAFLFCNGINSLTIPFSVTSVGQLAFFLCSGMNEVHCEGTIPPAVDTTFFFSGTDFLNCKLYVPKGRVSAYRNAIGWNVFTNILEELFTSVPNVITDTVDVYSENGTIVVTGLSPGDWIRIYEIFGSLLYQKKASTEELILRMPANRIYIVQAGSKFHKISL